MEKPMSVNDITHEIIAAAIEVHRALCGELSLFGCGSSALGG
jgi:hypothetical protein